MSDGGVSVRDAPRGEAKWRSANGDMGTMEVLSASYDPSGDRWIACAQDNSCMLSPHKAGPDQSAVSVVGGDGTVTAVDAQASPPRLFGGVQSFGTDDDEEKEQLQQHEDSDDDDDEEEEEKEEEDDDAGRTRRGARARPSGLRFVQGDRLVDVPVPSYFEPRQLPYFVQPFALNAIRPTRVVLWANSTADGTGRAGVYEFFVPCIPICAPGPGTKQLSPPPAPHRRRARASAQTT